MGKINIVALGGLNENGKNLYVVEVNNNILVFDCGIKYAADKMYGIDYVVPDFKYLIENASKIKGVFITHPHTENMGSLTDLIKVLPNISVYVSEFAKHILEYECKEEDVVIKNLFVAQANRKIDFGDFSVFPFSVTHSSPQTLGYCVNTSDGAIIYMADYLIDPTMSGHYNMDLGKLAYIGKQGVLCLMNESVFSEKKGHTSPNHKLEGFFKTVIDRNKNRIIFSVIPLHISTISEIFNALKGKNRKIVLMGKELYTIIGMCIKEGYLDISNNLIGDLTNLRDDNSIILVSNDREKPYSNLIRMVDGYDKFVKIEKTDTICFADPSYDAYEEIVVKLMNDIAFQSANIEFIPKDKSVRYHASSEDIMLLIKLFNPVYYMPVKGEYRYMVGNASLAKNVNINESNIILRGNGEVVSFENGKLLKSNNSVFVDDILIDGKSSKDVGELVLKDREMLCNNCIIFISATLSKKNKEVVTGPEIVTRGFIYVKENTIIIEEIKRRALDIIKKNTNERYADYSKIRNDVREIIGSYLFKETECKPVILTVIQEI
ncbi:MAG: ribonuclease J [Bacilli bacterium]